MATFAVSASDDMVKSLSEIMDSLAQDGEKKADTLKRIFDIAVQNADDDMLQSGGVDVSALDAALENIRSMFVTAVTGREQIVANYNQKLADVKRQKSTIEAELREKFYAEKEAREQAEKDATNAEKTAAQAKQDAYIARDAAETNAELAKEKDKTILALTEKLAAAEAKASGYDNLAKAKSEAENKVIVLEARISTDKREHEKAIVDMKKEMDRAVSDAQKDAALAREKAVQEAIAATQNKMQAEMQALRKQLMTGLREADKENGRLLAKIELQQEEIERLRGLKTAK